MSNGPHPVAGAALVTTLLLLAACDASSPGGGADAGPLQNGGRPLGSFYGTPFTARSAVYFDADPGAYVVLSERDDLCKSPQDSQRVLTRYVSVTLVTRAGGEWTDPAGPGTYAFVDPLTYLLGSLPELDAGGYHVGGKTFRTNLGTDDVTVDGSAVSGSVTLTSPAQLSAGSTLRGRLDLTFQVFPPNQIPPTPLSGEFTATFCDRAPGRDGG